VSSLIAENKLLDFLPIVNMIKQNYGDQPLGMPADRPLLKGTN